MALRCLCAALCLLCASTADAQLDRAITTQELMEPWSRAEAVLASIKEGPTEPAPLNGTLSALDAALADLQSQQESVAMRIVGDPAFGYDASDISREMGIGLATVSARFEDLWAALHIGERSDVQAARAALGALQRKLSARNPFERDVLRALGSGGKQEILALSTSWWDALTGVDKVRAALTALQNRIGAASGRARDHVPRA